MARRTTGISTATWLLRLLATTTTTIAQQQQQQQQPYHNWTAAYAAANQTLSSWTLEQTLNITIRNGLAPGYTPFDFSDGPDGVNGCFGCSGWVNAQTLASSWDVRLLAEHHAAMAAEFAAKGHTMAGAPTTGPLGRSVYGGRLFESLGSDPYLNGKLTAKAVAAIQSQNVISCGKHYIANEQETNRTGTANARTSSNLDDRTLHELYLWPWIDAVHAGMGAVMCSMNRINGSTGCENSRVLVDALKTQTGFLGLVVPDVTTPVNATESLLAGLDWNAGPDLAALAALVANGSVPRAVMAAHARRILAAVYNYSPPHPPSTTTDSSNLVVVRQPASAPLIRSAGAQSVVLLKNTGHHPTAALPLRNMRSVAVFGADAANLGAGPAPAVDVFDFGGDAYPSHLVTGGGSGQAPVPYAVSPLDALTRRAADADGLFSLQFVLSDDDDDDDKGDVDVDWAAVDACLVFVNAYAKEGADRRDLAVAAQDELVLRVAGACNNTIVVLNSAGARLVDRWIEHDNVTAVLNAGLLGEQSGNAIADVLFGAVNPSGKLVYTIARNESDYNGDICPCCECDYVEGLYIDYRHFDQAGIEPRFEFGFGLSYTTFGYSDLAISTEALDRASIPAYATGATIEGGPADLFDDLVAVTVAITNTGSVAGAEVAQLYLALPAASNAPVKQLRGFQKLDLEPGESKTATFALQRRDLSVWDTVAQAWRVDAGSFHVLVGKSSRDIVLNGTFSVVTD